MRDWPHALTHPRGLELESALDAAADRHDGEERGETLPTPLIA